VSNDGTVELVPAGAQENAEASTQSNSMEIESVQETAMLVEAETRQQLPLPPAEGMVAGASELPIPSAKRGEAPKIETVSNDGTVEQGEFDGPADRRAVIKGPDQPVPDCENVKLGEADAGQLLQLSSFEATTVARELPSTAGVKTDGASDPVEADVAPDESPAVVGEEDAKK